MTKNQRLTTREKEILDLMRDGWTPFVLQVGKVGQSLVRKGYATQRLDEKLQPILIPTSQKDEPASPATTTTLHSPAPRLRRCHLGEAQDDFGYPGPRYVVELHFSEYDGQVCMTIEGTEMKVTLNALTADDLKVLAKMLGGQTD